MAGRLLLEAEQLAQTARLLDRQPLQDERPLVGLQLGDQVGRVVVLELSEEPGSTVRGQRGEELAPLLALLHLGECF